MNISPLRVYMACGRLINVPVPYEYGTHQCVEPRFHALEPHLSRTSRALSTRVPRTRAAVRGVHATRIPTQAAVPRISTHLRTAVPRISMQLEAAAPRISTQIEAVVRRISMTLQATHSRAIINVVLRFPTKLSTAVSNAAMASCNL